MASHNHGTHHGGRRAAVIYLSLLAVALVATIVADAQPQVGFVLNVRGDWVLNNSQVLKIGTPVTANGRVQARGRRDGDFIEVADRGGRVIARRACNSGGCGQVIVLPAASPGVGYRLFGAAMALLNNDSERFVVLLSRGGELREAVVKTAGEQVDLSAVLANMSAGTYLLRFEPKSAGTPAGARTLGPISVEWDPAKLTHVTVPGLTPGLYVVQPLNNEDREPLEPGTESWVLFVRPEKFDKTSCEFKEAVVLTNGWGEETLHVSKRQFLRVALSQLEVESR